MNSNQYRRLFTVIYGIAAAISFLFLQSGVKDAYHSNVIRVQKNIYENHLAEERRQIRDSSWPTESRFRADELYTGRVVRYPDHIRAQQDNLGFIAGLLVLILLIVSYFILWTVLCSTTRYVREGFGNEQGEKENE